jgi:AraC family cel operon transcriptional repressor
MVHLAKLIARKSPGAPFVAFVGKQPATGWFRRDYAEILAVFSGEGRVNFTRSDGSIGSISVRPGQMFFFRPMDTHEIYPTGDEGVSVATVAFPFPSWQKFASLTAIDAAAFTLRDPPMVEFDLEDPDALGPFRLALQAFVRGPTQLDLVGFLSSAIGRFLPATAAGSGGPAWFWSAMVAMTDEQNLHGGIGRFAELAHVTPSHLWRSTRRYLGLTPTDVVRGIQLEHATHLLDGSDATVAVISERCGFSSASYFSKAFTRRFGISPRQYRTRTDAITVQESAMSARSTADLSS